MSEMLVNDQESAALSEPAVEAAALMSRRHRCGTLASVYPGA